MMRKNYFFITLFAFILLAFSNNTFGQLSVTSTGADFTISFDATVSGVNNGVFAGSGFTSTPGTGQLDSDAWRITGFGTNVSFGGTGTSGDPARGSSSGGVSTGGVYAFEVSASDYALGVQPGGSDFTPGTFTLLVTNNTGSTVTSLELDYEVWILNNEGRGNNLTFAWSTDDSGYTAVGALDVTSPDAADGGPAWASTARNTTITGLSLANGSSIYLRWSGDDVSGSGSRDEFAIDDIVVNMAAAATSTTWDGSEGTDWSNADNWSDGVPTSSLDAIIPDLANDPIIGASTHAETDDITVTSGVLTIAAGGSLDVNGTASGSLTYQRTLTFTAGNTNGWYLMGPPVSSFDFNDTYVSNNDIAANGSNRAIGDYNTTTDAWDYLQSGGSWASVSGRGYAMKRGTSTGTVSFSGVINDADVDYSMSSAGNGFNLLGNPFPAYVNSATLLTANTGVLESETIWLWNQGTGNYETKVTADSFIIAPGQGFFVDASSSSNFTFAKTNQQGNSDTFQRNSNSRPEIHLLMTDGTSDRFAKVYYIAGTTTGFDNGYDGEAFGGQSNAIDVYTHLVTDSEGKNFQVQSLPDSNFENMIVPVGVKSGAGTVTFSVDDFNLPAGYKVFLEDKDTGNFIRLDEDGSKYDVTFDNPVDGIGRFFLHMNTNALSTGSFDLTNISAYMSDSRNLRVVGIQSGTTQVRLFNILGKQVFNTSIQSNGVDNVSIPSLRQGVYIVQITSEQGTINKKVIIE